MFLMGTAYAEKKKTPQSLLAGISVRLYLEILWPNTTLAISMNPVPASDRMMRKLCIGGCRRPLAVMLFRNGTWVVCMKAVVALKKI